MIRTRIKNLEDTMETLVLTPNSSVKSSTTDSFYFPGCRKDTNCNCEMCVASINATLDLMPESVHRSSLTKLSISRRKIQRSPVSFPLSSEFSTPKLSRRVWPATASPPQKSTAVINFNENVKREKGELGFRVFLLRFVLGLILICGVEYGFPWIFSGILKSRLSPEIVNNLAENSWIHETLNGRQLFLKNGLEEFVGNRVSSCGSADSAWKINQDGLLLNSRCVLYESMVEDVSIWGWPLQTAGLLRAEYSSRSFSIISGRVTEWSSREANYSVHMANSSWELEKWSFSVVQFDPNTWILEYRQSFLLENSKPISATLMFLKSRLIREFEKFKQEFCRLQSAFLRQHSNIIGGSILVPT
ncbi:hypothetical protein ACS0TY_027505 [Phlomoides rotata]